MSAALALFVCGISLAQADGGVAATDAGLAPLSSLASGADPGASTGPIFRAGIELGFTSYPSGPLGGQQDLLGDVTPLLSIDAAEDFSLELGAAFRLRLFDDPPAQRDQDIGGVLRKADWDEPSDFGQIIRYLRIAGDDSALGLRVGRFRKYSLGLGHLLSRYSNQENPDYHPAGAWGRAGMGPLRLEAFASDIFGARLIAAEAALDFGRLLSNAPEVAGRYQVALSFAHDFGLAAGRTPPLTLMHIDVSAVFARSASTRAMLLTGVGWRLNPLHAGALFGGAVETSLGALKLSVKAELRKQYGGFRQGFFNANYELSRYAGTGFSGVSLLDERLPDTFSGYAEVRMGAQAAFSLDMGFEYFAFGRADADASLALETFGPRFTWVLRASAVGMGVTPRYSAQVEARVRLFSSFYVLGYAGTVFTPQQDGSLTRGGYGGVGVGFDVEKQLP